MTGSERIKQIEDVHDISAITYGFMASKALFAALDFDLFTHIEEGINSVAKLARETNISENRLVTLLAALKSVGLIAEREGRLINAPATSKFLVAGAPGDFRDYVRLVNGAAGYESFRHLSAALRGERVFPDKGFYEGLFYSAGIGGEQFSSAQHSGSLGPARLMTKRIDLSDRKNYSTLAEAAGLTLLPFARQTRCSGQPFSISRRQSRRPGSMRGNPDCPTVLGIWPETPSQRIGPKVTMLFSCPMCGALSAKTTLPSLHAARSMRFRRMAWSLCMISWSTTLASNLPLPPGTCSEACWTIRMRSVLRQIT